ncbi:peptide ABC transporter substrate-binding protein [Stakelama tenebrarum]|uniref:Peptide ABC transporter substrate-binding protein n=1 Tax=Stakelama tenebrarum TaxID=2711215 RepID=A0A6G6Y9D8_9SPHN|nr:peptide ABC transporter substrate-binding protein [Sphingosinithalassobacter tenebrarum]QIG81186.1 peptide ABC transporter substrate-binding protein [Sphingosinithalassobacter tenebrarum]
MFSRREINLATLSLLALGGCARGGEDGDDGTAIIRLSDDEVKGLDPQKVSDLTSLRVAADQFEGLMRYTGTGEAEPGLAAAPECDGLIWRFALRPGLRFSDGAPITPEHFARGWQRLQASETASPTASLFDGIVSVTAQAPGNVVVRLSRPIPHLPYLLAHPAMAALPLHRIAAAGDRWTSDRPLVTSGPYRLTRWRLGDRIALEANPAWHGGAPAAPRIDWHPAEDKLAALRRFRGGMADTVSDIPPTRLNWARKALPGAVHVHPYAGTYYFAFNTRRPPFNDSRVRQALSMAVDRRWIARDLLGTGEEAATGLVPPALGGINADPLGNDPDRIRHLLSAAGYGPESPLRFTIRFNSGGDHRRIAVALAAMWRPYGVEAQLLNSEAQLHFAALRTGDFQLARSGWIADVPAAENFLAVHRSDAGAINYSGYADREYDRLVDAGMAGDDAALRAAELRLQRAAPILLLHFYVSRSLVAPDIGGWQDNGMNIHPSRLLNREPR